MTTKFRFTTLPHPDEPSKSHFYASSFAEWHTDDDLDALIKRMKKAGHDFNLFYVPVPNDAAYEIKRYTPQVPGTIWLGAYLTDE